MDTPEEQIDAITLRICEAFAQDVTDDIKAALANAYPPASSPGESPHRRSGELQEGVVYSVIQQGATTQVLIESTAAHSAPLEFGAPSRNLEPRPFMEPAQEKWLPILIDRLQDAFGSPSPVISPAGAIVPTEGIAA